MDILFLSETKIDDSFMDVSVENYHLWRAGRSDKGGGVIAYLRSDIAGERQKDDEFTNIEAISIEVNLNKENWLFCGAYKPPAVPDELFFNDCSLTMERISANFDSYIFLGDLNFDMLCNRKKNETLVNICDLFNLQNVIKTPSCFTANGKPSLLDAILTNNSESISKTCNFSPGLSDVHNMIAC